MIKTLRGHRIVSTVRDGKRTYIVDRVIYIDPETRTWKHLEAHDNAYGKLPLFFNLKKRVREVVENAPKASDALHEDIRQRTKREPEEREISKEEAAKIDGFERPSGDGPRGSDGVRVEDPALTQWDKN